MQESTQMSEKESTLEYEDTPVVALHRVKKIFSALCLTVVLLSILCIFLFVAAHKKNKKIGMDVYGETVVVDVKTHDEVLSAISKLMVLPNEESTFTVLTDPEFLKKQPFFANAEVGDIVLVYSNSKRAILYSPQKNKIVEVGTATLTPEPATGAPLGN